MMKTIILLFFFLLSLGAFAQREFPIQNQSGTNFSDSLFAKRKIMHTNVYQNSRKLSKKKFSSLLKTSTKWTRKNKISNIMIPAAPFVSAGGVYLAYDAIKGIPMVEIIDGVEYPYVVRSLPKLIGGIALFVSGLAMIESANEIKTNAVLWYNDQIEKESKTALRIQFGISNSGGLGLSANF